MEQRKNNLFITEILSRAFNLCTDNFVEILKVLGIFIAPALIIPIILFSTIFATVAIGSSMYSYSSSYIDSIFATLGIGTILIFILIFLAVGIIALFGSLVIIKLLDDANKGNEVSWKSATRYVWDKKWGALGLNILVYLMFILAMIVLLILFFILSFITLGIGLIILIPLFIAIIVVASPLLYLFNSTFLVRDLGVTDSIRETFLLFRKGYFWSTIGRLAAISGISMGIGVVLALLQLIPIIGIIVATIGQYIVLSYVSAYLNIFVLDRSKPDIDNFGGNDDLGDSFIDPII